MGTAAKKSRSAAFAVGIGCSLVPALAVVVFVSAEGPRAARPVRPPSAGVPAAAGAVGARRAPQPATAAAPESVPTQRARLLPSGSSRPPPQPAPDFLGPASRVATLAASIRASDGEQKQVLVKEYLAAADRLPEERRIEALAQLNSLAAAPAAPPDTVAADALWVGIQSAGAEEARQDLIREYLEYIQGLPPDDVMERVAKLNADYGRREPPAR